MPTGVSDYTEPAPPCFADAGKCEHLSFCASCGYAEACRFCADHPTDQPNTRLGFVSYERLSGSDEVADPETIPALDLDADAAGRPVYSNSDLIALLDFFATLDDYSLALSLHVICVRPASVSDIARAFHCSRQAVHRKLLDSCARHPELRTLLRATLCRCYRLTVDQKLKSAEHRPGLYRRPQATAKQGKAL